MLLPRPNPFDLAFEASAQTSFPLVREAITDAGLDPRDRDGFLMLRDVVTLLRDLRPEEGLGEGIDQLAALLHHAYLFWNGGSIAFELSAEQLLDLIRHGPVSGEDDTEPPPYYLRLPERKIWAQVVPGQAHEPLDGYFQHLAPEPGILRVLGVFGMHPDRPGFSVVEVAGPKPLALARTDGSPLFAPTLPGGAAAGLLSISGEEELLQLGWRTREVVLAAEAARWRA